MVDEAVLFANLECLAIKTAIFIKTFAERFQKRPCKIILFFMRFQNLCKIHIKNTVHQIKFIFKMIVKAFTIHAAFFADFRDIDLGKRFLLHEFFQCGSQGSFCNIRISHCDGFLPTKNVLYISMSYIPLYWIYRTISKRKIIFLDKKRNLSKKSYKKTVKCKNRTSLRICPMHGRKEIDYNIKWSRLELQSRFG